MLEFLDFIGRVVLMLIVCEFGSVWWRRRATRKLDQGILLGGVRVVAGIQPGFLTREWQSGCWRFDEKRLRFEKWDIAILGMVAGSRRTATWSERIRFGETVILRLRTETAEIEWSVLERVAARAIRRLNAPSVPGLPAADGD